MAPPFLELSPVQGKAGKWATTVPCGRCSHREPVPEQRAELGLRAVRARLWGDFLGTEGLWSDARKALGFSGSLRACRIYPVTHPKSMHLTLI